MADLAPRNLAWIRQNMPQVAEALEDMTKAVNNGFRQVNASPVGRTPAPQAHAGLSVKGGAGLLDVAITDNSPQYQGQEHFFDYSSDGWKTFHTKSLGPAKNWRGTLGTGTFQVRSYAQYPTSDPSPHIYHPPVSTGSATEPPMQAGQGSGTGQSGYGSQPYSGNTPPKRS